ncbi:hypothetical protein [Roseibium alexandrii]|uniref:hypothetical protein n=1 Tax=Roseibium alexandrii TaxID=388408 RepID=UPI0037516804
MTCFDREKVIDDGLSRLRTQYRESPNLIAVIRHGLEQIADVADAICTIPEEHEILSGVGDQLTNVGKRLGWPRCHCVCGNTNLCQSDDEVYRGFLLARRYQVLRLFDVVSLEIAAAHIWGATANVRNLGGARVAVGPGRALTASETEQIQLAFRVLPIAPGIQPFLETATGPVWGFGAGWAGLCDGRWSCPVEIDPYGCDE